MQRHIFHTACWIEWQWALGCDLHTPLHSGWYFLMVLGRVKPLQQQHHPLPPSPAVRSRPGHVGLYLFHSLRLRGSSNPTYLPRRQTRHCSAELLGVVWRRYHQKMETDRHYSFPRGSSPGWNVRSSQTHLYCIQGWRLCEGFNWDTSTSFTGYAYNVHCRI